MYWNWTRLLSAQLLSKGSTFLALSKKLVFVLTVLAGRTMVDYPSTLLTNKTASSRDKIWVLTWLHFMSKGVLFYSLACPFITPCIFSVPHPCPSKQPVALFLKRPLLQSLWPWCFDYLIKHAFSPSQFAFSGAKFLLFAFGSTYCEAGFIAEFVSVYFWYLLGQPSLLQHREALEFPIISTFKRAILGLEKPLVLKEELSLVPITCILWPTTDCNSRGLELHTLLASSGTLYSRTCPHIDIHIMKKNKTHKRFA